MWRLHACMLSHFSCVRLFGTPWTVAPQAPLARGFSRQEYWSGLPCPLPGDLLHPGIEPTSLTYPILARRFLPVLVWRIPGAGEPGGPPSTGSHRIGHDWSDLAAAAAVHILFIFQAKNSSHYNLKIILCLVFLLVQFLFSTTSKSVLSVHLFC